MQAVDLTLYFGRPQNRPSTKPVASYTQKSEERHIPRRNDSRIKAPEKGTLFSALESGRPDSWKIRSTLFWTLVFQIRAILKNQGGPQKPFKNKLRANKKIKKALF